MDKETVNQPGKLIINEKEERIYLHWISHNGTTAEFRIISKNDPVAIKTLKSVPKFEPIDIYLISSDNDAFDAFLELEIPIYLYTLKMEGYISVAISCGPVIMIFMGEFE